MKGCYQFLPTCFLRTLNKLDKNIDVIDSELNVSFPMYPEG